MALNLETINSSPPLVLSLDQLIRDPGAMYNNNATCMAVAAVTMYDFTQGSSSVNSLMF